MNHTSLLEKQRSWVEINLSHYEHNIGQLAGLMPAGASFLQVVKADAYGHGAVEIAKKAISLGIDFFGVASTREGIQLRSGGIKSPILILSPCFDFEIKDIFKYNFIPSVSTFDFAKKLSAFGKPINIHINVDTGMGRSGFYFDGARGEIEKIHALANIEVQGIFSHFAASDDDSSFTNEQNQKFKELLGKLTFKPKYLHIANSHALFSADLAGTDLVRVGLLSFGASLAKQSKVNLLPVLSFRTKIIQIKTARKGDTIGYNRTFVADKNMQYAILPIGYADGYNYLLGNSGVVLVGKHICKILGKVSMDMIAVDVSGTRSKVGDRTTLLGWQHRALSPQNIASSFGGSPYELCCNAGRRSTRFFFDGGRLKSVHTHLERGEITNNFQ